MNMTSVGVTSEYDWIPRSSNAVYNSHTYDAIFLAQ